MSEKGDLRSNASHKQWRLNEFESGGTGPAQSVDKFFLVVPLHFFGSKCTLSRFGERFCDGQYSSVSFLSAVLLLTVLPCPAICKSGRHVPPLPHGVGALRISVNIRPRNITQPICTTVYTYA